MMSGSQNDGYNGWSNYETWNVSLWLSNDEPMYHDVNRLAARTDGADELADEIESYVRDSFGTFGKFGDLDTDAELDDVDWIEVAKGWLDE